MLSAQLCATLCVYQYEDQCVVCSAMCYSMCISVNIIVVIVHITRYVSQILTSHNYTMFPSDT